MKVHSLLLLAYLVALVAFATSQGVNNGGNSGSNNVGKLSSSDGSCFGQSDHTSRGAAACVCCRPKRCPTCCARAFLQYPIASNENAMSLDAAIP